MTTLLKKDYQYSSVLWEEVMQRVQEIIRDEYNISPYVSPTLNPKTPSPFRIWSSAQGTDALYVGAWHKEYTISVNHYLKTEDSERFYKKVYEESERLYQLFFNNQGTQSTQTLGFFGGRPEGIQISQEGDYFRIEVLFTCEVLRADDVVYVQALPSEIRATRRALELPFNFWSLDFDGTDDYINLGSFTTSGDLTVSMWFQVRSYTDDGSQQRTLLVLASSNVTDAIIINSYNGRNDIDVAVKYNAGDDSRYNFRTTTTFDLNKWYNIVVTKTGGEIGNVYINGVQETRATPTLFVSIPTGVNQIGSGTSQEYVWNGLISETAIFNSVLSSSEISTIYNDGQPILLTENQGGYKSSANLVAYYRMGSGSGDDRDIGTKNFGLVADQLDTSVGENINNVTSYVVSDAGDEADTLHSDFPNSSTPNIEANTLYKIEMDITGSNNYGYLQLAINYSGASMENLWQADTGGANGEYREYVYSGSNAGALFIRAGGSTTWNGTASNISVKKIGGNGGILKNFDGLDFRTNVPLLYDKALFSNSLVFDGTDDWIDIENFSYDVYNSGDTKPFSISVWFKMNEGLTSDNNYKGALFSDDNNLMLLAANHVHGSHTRIYGLTGGIGESSHGNGWEYYLALDTNWHHIVWTVEKNATNYAKNSLYIDGVQVQIRNGDGGTNGANRGTGTFNAGTGYWEGNANFDEQTSEQLYRTTSTLLVSSGDQTSTVQSQWTAAHIGRNRSLENYFPGSVSDLGFFNVTLDATNVTAIYNSGKPIDLTCDAGNYNNANNLVGYWKMGDGYLDELPSATNQGGIFDQVTPIIKDYHTIYANGFSSVPSPQGFSDEGESATINSNGQMVLVGKSGGDYAYILNLIPGTSSGDYEANVMYKMEIDIESFTGTGGWFYNMNGSRPPQKSNITTTGKHIRFFTWSESYAAAFRIGAGTTDSYLNTVIVNSIKFEKLSGNPGQCINMNASAQSISVPE